MKDILLSSITAAGKPLEIWFQDEACVGQKGTHTYVWAPVGSCPLMVRDNRHDSVHLFGAICPARGVGAAIIMPAVNTGAMNGHLQGNWHPGRRWRSCRADPGWRRLASKEWRTGCARQYDFALFASPRA